MTAADYPSAEREARVDDLHGHRVPDPYRWLEEAGDARTEAWQRAQDDLFSRYAEGLPGRDTFADRVAELLGAGAVDPPAWRGDREFRTRREPGQDHAVLSLRLPDGTRRVLVDPNALDPAGTTTLDHWAPSPSGRRLAYQLSTGGDEESRLYVLDVDTGELLDGPIDRCRYSPIAWPPDETELYYVRRLPADEVPAGEEQFHRRVYRHRLADTAPDVEVFGAGLDPTSYYGVEVSRDGRWLVLTASAGTAPRTDAWIVDLNGTNEPVEIQRGVDARVAPWVGRDGRLYLWTDRDAPRGRLVVTDPETPTAPHWQTLIPEDPEAVLEDIAILDDRVFPGDTDTRDQQLDRPLLAVLRTRHAVAELTLHDLATGAETAAVPLPGLGTVTGLTARRDGGHELWVGWTDHTTPPGVHRYDAATAELTLDERAPGQATAPAVQARQVTYTSHDGTTVRMFVLAPTDAVDGPRPTVLYGYGGFDVSLTPGYSATALAWVEAGGVWAVANLRGGSEEGEEWHRAGMREHKQNVFDDLHAAGDHLVAEGWTDRSGLAVMGGSNGGLLVGAAVTQRPQAYAAAVCSAPLLDMVRYERFGLGRTWSDEYGTADDPEELRWLLSYSPYHHVHPGVRYPAVLFTTFASDTRVDPLHARKMAAALQHASTANAPILLRTEADVGHGARSVRRTAVLAGDQLAFLAATLGGGPGDRVRY
ncbi:MAG: Prolyl oligopeptidase [Cryptosporangiaceae bacterium]|jgi:prolyl oligopeptidase|nr:Prolyl oligopeptidase [Cryptosporangiaceae bacterium]